MSRTTRAVLAAASAVAVAALVVGCSSGGGTPASTAAGEPKTGGTLTYQWSNGRPRLRNEVTLWPLPVAAETAITWASMGAWPAIWRQCALTLAEQPRARAERDGVDL